MFTQDNMKRLIWRRLSRVFYRQNKRPAHLFSQLIHTLRRRHSFHILRFAPKLLSHDRYNLHSLGPAPVIARARPAVVALDIVNSLGRQSFLVVDTPLAGFEAVLGKRPYSTEGMDRLASCCTPNLSRGMSYYLLSIEFHSYLAGA